MRNSILNIERITVLSKESQKQINGAILDSSEPCGCSCSGSVTGPARCRVEIACPQVYTCDEATM
ncbi:hypothetical protein [Aquimarina pacifica]|uniref:hypothetical protein n=1 Tax=Aquimarina pacifica TaxID=1296415 RepID=UPI000471A99E|nr:hypothetical protein [Aquimarina pacifica]